uniref:Ferredoxin n=1 Tax=Kalanchoe fedtschenkoi TaxID=63787 RepID=A0A7N0SYQ1_KALFE
MALAAAARRFSSPSSQLLRRHLFKSSPIWSFNAARFTATLSSFSSSAKVSDRIVKLFAIDPEGRKREIVGLAGQTLLKALTNSGLIDPASHRLEDIDACSAECEVNIAQEWLEKLPPPSYDEQYVLRRSSRARVLNKHSRLACQVVLSPELQDARCIE